MPGFMMDPLLVGFVCVNPGLGSAADSVRQLNQTSLLTRFDGGIILQEIFGNLQVLLHYYRERSTLGT